MQRNSFSLHMKNQQIISATWRPLPHLKQLSLNQPKQISQSVAVTISELQLAEAACSHMSVSSVGHIKEIIKKNATGSPLEDIRLHHTKCWRLMDQVISPALKQELIDDISKSSTDCAVNKNVCICLIYFSEESEQMEFTFLGLFPVVSATGESLLTIIKNAISDVGLSLSNCIGFGSDGAAGMVGERNSVWSRFREKAPNCLLFRCVCHSSALYVGKAFNSLPST